MINIIAIIIIMIFREDEVLLLFLKFTYIQYIYTQNTMYVNKS